MAIAWRAGSSAGNSTGTNATVNKPTGTVDGDILIAVTYREAGAWTLPSGWAWVAAEQVNNDGDAWVRLAWKRAASEPSSWTFSMSTSNWRIVTVGAWSGCAASGTPFEAAAGYSTTGYPVIAASITTTVADTMCVVGMANLSGTNIGAGSTGYTQREQLGGCELWERAMAATGSTGTKTFSDSSNTGDWATFHLALLPAGSGAQTISPSAIASGEAFGSSALQPGAVSVAPSGVGSVEAFGVLLLGLGVLPTGVGSAEAHGSASVVPGAVSVLASGISSAEAHGSATLARGAVSGLPTGVGSAEAHGSATIARGAVNVLPGGVSSAEVHGSATVVPGAAG